MKSLSVTGQTFCNTNSFKTQNTIKPLSTFARLREKKGLCLEVSSWRERKEQQFHF